MATIGVIALAAVAGILFVTKSRRAGQGATPEATPAPETVEMAREVAEQEVAKQTQALRERLSNEILTPSPVPASRRPAAPPPGPAAVIVPTPLEAPAGAPAADAAAAAVVAPAAVQEPTQAPTEVPPIPTAEQAPAPEQPVALLPVVQEGDLVELGGDVVPPQPVYFPKPVYPPLAERQRVSGTVFLDVLVDENGAVRDVKVLRGVKPDFGLDAAAASAVRNWRYRPATKGGVRVKVRITQPVVFKLARS